VTLCQYSNNLVGLKPTSIFHRMSVYHTRLVARNHLCNAPFADASFTPFSPVLLRPHPFHRYTLICTCDATDYLVPTSQQQACGKGSCSMRKWTQPRRFVADGETMRSQHVDENRYLRVKEIDRLDLNFTCRPSIWAKSAWLQRRSVFINRSCLFGLTLKTIA